MKNLATIIDEFSDSGEDSSWSVEDFLTLLYLSNMDKLELYNSCEEVTQEELEELTQEKCKEMTQEELEELWSFIQALRTAVLDVLNINN